MTGLHGSRATYQGGCRCTPCHVANAAYQATYRAQAAHGVPPLGAHISAADAHRKIARLLLERFTKAELARRLGLVTPALQLSPTVITVRNHLKVRRLFRLAMGPDRPDRADDANV